MIPLARPWIDDAEVDAVAAVLRSGMLVQGALVARFEAALAERCGRRFAIAVANGTSALGLAYRALELRAGDEIVVPALTWPSPAHAAAELGLHVQLADVDPDEWNATPETFRAARTDQTRLLVVIDQFGTPARPELLSLGLPVLEDAACALGSVFADGRPCGSLGIASCLSFHPRKLVTTGEGGAVLTDDEGLAQAIRELRNHGQRAPGVFARAAGNARLGEMQAAMGLAQLDKLDAMIEARREHASAIRGALGDQLRFQQVALGARSNEQTLGARLPTEVPREAFVEALRARGVGAGLLSYDLVAIGTLEGALPSAGLPEALPSTALFEARALAARGVALPLFAQMSIDERERVIEAVESALAETRSRQPSGDLA